MIGWTSDGGTLELFFFFNPALPAPFHSHDPLVWQSLSSILIHKENFRLEKCEMQSIFILLFKYLYILHTHMYRKCVMIKIYICICVDVKEMEHIQDMIKRHIYIFLLMQLTHKCNKG